MGWSWLLLSIDNYSTFLGSALGCQIIILFCKFHFGKIQIKIDLKFYLNSNDKNY